MRILNKVINISKYKILNQRNILVKNTYYLSLLVILIFSLNTGLGLSESIYTKSFSTSGLINYPYSPSGFVASSELINYYSMTTQEVTTFVGLIKAQGFTEITLRLNAMNEWSSEQPSSNGASKTKEIITKCQENGISVSLDLHTWYTTWDNYFRDSASNSVENREKYINYVINTIDAFSGYPVKAWMILNEPQARTATSSENQFILNIISAAKSQTTKPVSVRFMCGYSPSTGHYSEQIDQACDFLCRNTYWDSRNPSTSVYGTTEAKMTYAINTAKSLGKEIWMSEFGKTNSDEDDQSDFIRAFIAYAKEAEINRVFAWVIQPENPSGETYNLFGSNYQPLPAFYEIKS